MGDAAHMYSLGPGSGRLLVKTSRTGLGAKAGHDLTIEVTRWHGSALADPADLASAEVTLAAEVDSFAVREGTGGVKPLTDGDRAEISRTLREKILDSGRHPEITFRSTRTEGSAESLTVPGELTIRGVTQPITVHARVEGDRIQGSATVRQSLWGIKPYSALFGALKLADDVGVSFDLTVVPES